MSDASTRYRVIRSLGKGGMGEVVLAEDTLLERQVALKVLPPELREDPRARERFEREAKAAAALDHPFICKVYEVTTLDDHPCIVMEYVEGETLAARLRQGRVALTEALPLALEIAEALEEAHRRRILHRDLKPSNIMLTAQRHAKVMDFGLARRLPDPRVDASQAETVTPGLTGWGVRVGTPAYMAPEQVLGAALDERTDLFAFGIVLYELLAGMHPFNRDSPSATLAAIVREAPRPLTTSLPEAPASLAATVGKLLAKEPGDRYQSFGEVTSDLRRLREQLPARYGASTVRKERPARAVTARTRYVGRAAERAALQAAFDATARGQGLLLGVAGEPGIGKTTVVDEFLAHLDAEGVPCRIARGRCSERLAGAEAYLPVLEALDNLVRSDTTGSVTRSMKALAPTWYAQLTPSADADIGGAGPSAYAGTPERLKRELTGFFQEVTRLQPVIVFMEDLHWAGASTVELLAYLGTRLETMRLLLVATYRREELTLTGHPFLPVKQELQARGICRELSLGFLSERDVEEYVTLEFPDHELPGALPRLIHAKTEGNALFMVDLVRSLRARGVIVQQDGRWRLAQAVPDLARELPESVRTMIERKRGQLAEADQRLLVVASVQGEEFEAAVVAEVLKAEAAEVEERLDVLDREFAFVRRIGEHEFPDRTLTLRYRFVHVLYQNAFYGALMPARKAALSANVANALLQFYGDRSSDVASELALLFEAARDFARAVSNYLVAVQKAFRVFAYREVEQLARRGLALLETLPDAPERAEQELALLSPLVLGLLNTRGFTATEVKDICTRARAICVRWGGTRHVLPAIFGLFEHHLHRAEYHTALELAREVLSLAESERDPALLVAGHSAVGNTLMLRGDFRTALEHLEQAMALYDPQQHVFHTSFSGTDTDIRSRSFRALVLWRLGYPDRALEANRETVSLARTLSEPPSLAYALMFGAMLHQLRREARECQERTEELIHLASEHGYPSWLAFASFWRGWALANEGRMEEGIALMREILVAQAALGSRIQRSVQLALVATAYAQTHQADEGLAALDEGLALVQQTGEGFYEGEIHRLKGELLLRRAAEQSDRLRAGTPLLDGVAHVVQTEAEGCFHEAINVARRQNAKSLELRAVMSLSRLWQAQGKKTEARRMLAEIYDWFTEGFDTADLKDARALLELLS